MTTTTTETTAPVVVPAPIVVPAPMIAPVIVQPGQSETITQRSVDSNGVQTDRTRTITTGTTVSPYGDTTTTRRTTETTTVR
jgi:hypothetical protein